VEKKIQQELVKLENELLNEFLEEKIRYYREFLQTFAISKAEKINKLDEYFRAAFREFSPK
jgi:hypothetical protein